MTPRTLLLLLAAPVGGLLGPGTLRPNRGESLAASSVSRISGLAMMDHDDGSAVESKHFSFLRPLRAASFSVATAVLLAITGPRGSARAADVMEAPTQSATTSRQMGSAPSQLTFSDEHGQLRVGLLSPRRGTIEQLEEDMTTPAPDPEAGRLPSDLSDLLGRNAHREYTSRKFLFDEDLTRLSPLQEELEELDEYINSNKNFAKFKGVINVAQLGAVMYGTLRVLSWAEKKFILNEKQEMAEEMDLTGMYISIDAGEVEGAVDPKTGKNITVSGTDKLPSAEKSGDVASADGTEGATKEAPWLLRVLGLGNAASANDDSFWDDAVPAKPAQKDSGSSSGDDDSGGTEDSVEDDTEGLDTLEDLLG